MVVFRKLIKMLRKPNKYEKKETQAQENGLDRILLCGGR